MAEVTADWDLNIKRQPQAALGGHHGGRKPGFQLFDLWRAQTNNRVEFRGPTYHVKLFDSSILHLPRASPRHQLRWYGDGGRMMERNKKSRHRIKILKKKKKGKRSRSSKPCEELGRKSAGRRSRALLLHFLFF